MYSAYIFAINNKARNNNGVSTSSSLLRSERTSIQVHCVKPSSNLHTNQNCLFHCKAYIRRDSPMSQNNGTEAMPTTDTVMAVVESFPATLIAGAGAGAGAGAASSLPTTTTAQTSLPENAGSPLQAFSSSSTSQSAMQHKSVLCPTCNVIYHDGSEHICNGSSSVSASASINATPAVIHQTSSNAPTVTVTALAVQPMQVATTTTSTTTTTAATTTTNSALPTLSMATIVSATTTQLCRSCKRQKALDCFDGTKKTCARCLATRRPRSRAPLAPGTKYCSSCKSVRSNEHFLGNRKTCVICITKRQKRKRLQSESHLPESRTTQDASTAAAAAAAAAASSSESLLADFPLEMPEMDESNQENSCVIEPFENLTAAHAWIDQHLYHRGYDLVRRLTRFSRSVDRDTMRIQAEAFERKKTSRLFSKQCYDFVYTNLHQVLSSHNISDDDPPIIGTVPFVVPSPEAVQQSLEQASLHDVVESKLYVRVYADRKTLGPGKCSITIIGPLAAEWKTHHALPCIAGTQRKISPLLERWMKDVYRAGVSVDTIVLLLEHQHLAAQLGIARPPIPAYSSTRDFPHHRWYPLACDLPSLRTVDTIDTTDIERLQKMLAECTVPESDDAKNGESVIVLADSLASMNSADQGYVIWQQRYQRELIRQYDPRVVHLDISYCMNRYGAALLTLLISDGSGTEVPVAFAISTDPESANTASFLDCVFDACNWKPDIVWCDDVDPIFDTQHCCRVIPATNAIVDASAVCNRRGIRCLLSWHSMQRSVDIWMRLRVNTVPHDVRRVIRLQMSEFLRCQDDSEFEELTSVLTYFLGVPSLEHILTYLRHHILQRKSYWAPWLVEDIVPFTYVSATQGLTRRYRRQLGAVCSKQPGGMVRTLSHMFQCLNAEVCDIYKHRLALLNEADVQSATENAGLALLAYAQRGARGVLHKTMASRSTHGRSIQAGASLYDQNVRLNAAADAFSSCHSSSMCPFDFFNAVGVTIPEVAPGTGVYQYTLDADWNSVDTACRTIEAVRAHFPPHLQHMLDARLSTVLSVSGPPTKRLRLDRGEEAT
jgi:hypothetical protein